MANCEDARNGKKHPCSDCRFCQWCGDDRCHLCRGGRCAPARKLSLAEQVALYDALNGGKTSPSDGSG